MKQVRKVVITVTDTIDGNNLKNREIACNLEQIDPFTAVAVMEFTKTNIILKQGEGQAEIITDDDDLNYMG